MVEPVVPGPIPRLRDRVSKYAHYSPGSVAESWLEGIKLALHYISPKNVAVFDREVIQEVLAGPLASEAREALSCRQWRTDCLPASPEVQRAAVGASYGACRNLAAKGASA